MKKGEKVTYTSCIGAIYSAVIHRCHKDGSFTVCVYFPLRNGEEMVGCFQGDKFRVWPEALS